MQPPVELVNVWLGLFHAQGAPGLHDAADGVLVIAAAEVTHGRHTDDGTGAGDLVACGDLINGEHPTRIVPAAQPCYVA